MTQCRRMGLIVVYYGAVATATSIFTEYMRRRRVLAKGCKSRMGTSFQNTLSKNAVEPLVHLADFLENP